MRVWELIDSPTAVDEVCDRLGEEFEVDQRTCLGDVIELIRDLSAVGLVVIDDQQA